MPWRPDFSPWGQREQGFEHQMKATSRFRSAASAAAISAGLILSGAGAVQFVGVTQAVAAVVVQHFGARQ
jgi:hypothetical protein